MAKGLVSSHLCRTTGRVDSRPRPSFCRQTLSQAPSLTCQIIACQVIAGVFRWRREVQGATCRTLASASSGTPAGEHRPQQGAKKVAGLQGNPGAGSHPCGHMPAIAPGYGGPQSGCSNTARERRWIPKARAQQNARNRTRRHPDSTHTYLPDAPAVLSVHDILPTQHAQDLHHLPGCPCQRNRLRPKIDGAFVTHSRGLFP